MADADASAAERNRALLLTPAGVGAIAVVRLAGPGVAEFLAAFFDRSPRPGRCVHGTLRDGEHPIDDPVVALSADGHVADVNLHGGPWVVHECLELARRSGFDVADPADPVPDEAIDAIHEIEREMLVALPLARTERALRTLLSQPHAWRRMGALTAEQRREILADHSLWWLLHPPRVAIVGAPNVGKSTLANQLFAQERVITADLPGTTRDWVGEIADLDGLPVMLMDTPGLRASHDPVEAEAIRRSQRVIGGADLLVVVLDATRPLEPEQAPLLERFPDALRVLNKSDRARSIGPLDGPLIETVATTGRGVDQLRRAVRRHFGCDELEALLPLWWTARQRRRLEGAADQNRRMS